MKVKRLWLKFVYFAILNVYGLI